MPLNSAFAIAILGYLALFHHKCGSGDFIETPESAEARWEQQKKRDVAEQKVSLILLVANKTI